MSAPPAAAWSPARRASRFIYLNKTCFNGLYRVNSRGQFNVPFGDYENPKLVDEDNLRACAAALENTGIFEEPFTGILARARRNEQRDAARLPQLQGRNRVAVHEGRLDGGLVRAEFLHDAREPVVDRDEAFGERGLAVGLDRAAGHIHQPVAGAADHAPAGAAEPRIDPENANRLAHVRCVDTTSRGCPR